MGRSANAASSRPMRDTPFLPESQRRTVPNGSPRRLCGSHLSPAGEFGTLARTAVRFNPISYHNGSVWPHDNALIALGLARYGLKAPVLRIFKGLFDAVSYWEPRRLPELFCGFARRNTAPVMYPVACSPQAWASASVFALVQASLGLQFDPAAGEIRLIQPVMPDFLQHLHVRGLRLGDGCVDVLLQYLDGNVATTVTGRRGEAVRVVVVN